MPNRSATPMPPASVNRRAWASAASADSTIGVGEGCVVAASIQRSPLSGYENTIDSWTYRPAPAATAASTRWADPSRRRRSLVAHDVTRAALTIGGVFVARGTTAAWPATAPATRPASDKAPAVPAGP